ncbi:MAG: alpha/beta fold hydrolase [Mycobacteriales bacterium]
MDRRSVATRALGRLLSAPEPAADLPEGQMVDLPGRGRTFVVDVPGPPGAPTLVLLHALGCTGNLSWFPSIPVLAQDYRVVVLDQRWHGRGIRSKTFRLKDCADDVVALADTLGIDTFIPVGYSMGGLIAQLVWKRHPHRTEGLVLCATARNFRGARREKFFFPLMTAAMVPLSPYVRKRVERFAATLSEVPLTPAATIRSWGMAEFRSTSAWATPAVLRELGRFNSAPWIGQVAIPTAVVATTKDHTIPVRRQHRLAAAIKGATVHEVDGGHASIVLNAQRFVPALVEACGSVAGRLARLP